MAQWAGMEERCHLTRCASPARWRMRKRNGHLIDICVHCAPVLIANRKWRIVSALETGTLVK